MSRATRNEPSRRRWRTRMPVGLCMALLLAGAFAAVMVIKEHAVNGPERLEMRLVVAAAGGDLAEIRDSLGELPSDNESIRQRELVLRMACTSGHEAIVVELLERGVNPNCYGKQGATPLMCLGKRENSARLARRLLDAGADVNAVDRAGRTALMDAVASANIELMEVLIEEGADVDLVDRNGRSAWTEAAEMGDGTVLERLKAARHQSAFARNDSGAGV